MGIFSSLKEKAVGTPNHDLTVGNRGKSAFFSHTTSPSKQARFDEEEEEEEVVLDKKLKQEISIQSSRNAKSFTAGSGLGSSASLGLDSHIKRGIPGGLKPRQIEYRSISQFQQIVELYRGSISTVYKAVCSFSRTPVIIKAYQKSKMKEKNFLRMDREIRLMRVLEHDDSVVQLFSVFEDSSFKYLIMELCQGGDLFKAMLMCGGKMEETWVCKEMVVPLLITLVRLHGQHILHRDIKPENIFLTATQRFKLGDFGLAIQSSVELPFTRSGTLDYLSPEVLANPTCELQESQRVNRADLKQRGVRPYDEKVDCWAAGVLAYELVVGRPPFEVKDEAKTASAIMYKNDIALPSKHSPQWADFVMQALQKNPALRPTAAQLLEHPWVKMHTYVALPDVILPETLLPDLSLNTPSNPRHTQPPAPLCASGNLEAPRREVSAEGLLENGKVHSLLSGASQNRMGPEKRAGSTPLAPSPLGHKHSSHPAPVSIEVVASAASPARPEKAGEEAVRASRRTQKQSGTPRSGGGGLQLESSGGSFTALMAKAPATDPGYIESGDILTEQERRAGGMRIRMKRYFKRQA